jgi:hypothetical protein
VTCTARAPAGFVHVPEDVKTCTSVGVALLPDAGCVVALVMRPAASMVSAGICALDPYVPGVTPVDFIRSLPTCVICWGINY